MLVQSITNLNNYYAKPCNTIKKNNSAKQEVRKEGK